MTEQPTSTNEVTTYPSMYHFSRYPSFFSPTHPSIRLVLYLFIYFCCVGSELREELFLKQMFRLHFGGCYGMYLQGMQASGVVAYGLVDPAAGTFPDQGSTHVPRVDRWILNYLDHQGSSPSLCFDAFQK